MENKIKVKIELLSEERNKLDDEYNTGKIMYEYSIMRDVLDAQIDVLEELLNESEPINSQMNKYVIVYKHPVSSIRGYCIWEVKLPESLFSNYINDGGSTVVDNICLLDGLKTAIDNLGK